MSKKFILLALAAVSAVMFVLPAVASAGEWKLDPAGGKFPVSFTSVGIGSTTLTTDGSSLKVTCTGNTGSGKQITATTAEEVTITFTVCTENLFGSKCTSAGQATAGTIKTTDLVAHNVILETVPSEIRGVLLTPNAGHFASFVCGGGLVSVAVNGNGIIGEMTVPGPTECGAISKTSKLKFESPTTGTQKWNQVTTAGTKFDLTSTQGSGSPATASQDGEGTTTFPENMTFTC